MAEYIPITDQEIEPEAPLTSILQHKYRDNLLAYIERDPTAPKFSIWSGDIELEEWSRRFTSNFTGEFVTGGGLYSLNLQFYSNYSDNLNKCTINEVKYSGGTTTDVIIPKNNYLFINVQILGSGFCDFFINHVASAPELYTWLFIKVNKTSGNIDSFAYCPHHPSYGFDFFINHPFAQEDNSNHDLFVVNFTATDHLNIKKSTIPKIGGGFFGINELLNSSDIDFFSPKRSIIDSILDNFSINVGDILPWLSDVEFSILTPKYTGQAILSLIPDPSGVTRIGYSPK